MRDEALWRQKVRRLLEGGDRAMKKKLKRIPKPGFAPRVINGGQQLDIEDTIKGVSRATRELVALGHTLIFILLINRKCRRSISDTAPRADNNII